MKAVTKAVIDRGGEIRQDIESVFRNGLEIGIEELREERERLYRMWGSSNASEHFTFKDWLANYKEDDDMWMPEVGEECEVNVYEHPAEKFEVCKVIAINGDWIVFTKGQFERPFVRRADGGFRPIQSEEDRLTEIAFKSLTINNSDLAYKICQDLIQDNYRKIKPMTEDEFVSHFNKKFTGYSKVTAQKIYRAGCRFLDV